MLEGTDWLSRLGGRRRPGRSPVIRPAIELGGHVHVGLEFYGGDRTPTNAQLVEEAVAVCAELGRPVAGCDEAAAILGLPVTSPDGRPPSPSPQRARRPVGVAERADPVLLPGCYDWRFWRLSDEDAGFSAVYMTGFPAPRRPCRAA
ncbi:MAG: 3-keto-5-aminohexanoate cleavage protein [Ilumatobacteraceae bacterium]